MKRFILEQSDAEFYSSHSGLALFGLCLNRYGQLNQALEKGIPLRQVISHADMIKSIIGTLCLGKSYFEAIENHRDDYYFKAARRFNKCHPALALDNAWMNTPRLYLRSFIKATSIFWPTPRCR